MGRDNLVAVDCLEIKEVVEATKAEIVSLHEEVFWGVGTDTRVDLNGQLFIALRGPHFDAHDFVDKAIERKAAILLLDQKEVAKKCAGEVTCLLVEDTLKALHSLAHYWRKQLQAKVVGITGSNGKTTTKEFLATMTRQEFQSRASQGSFNNHWGVPLTLLSCQKSDEVVVLEMGMNHQGELTKLCEIAQPDITLVTNVGLSHIGEVGSLERIAHAKNEIYKASPQSQAIFNLDNPHTLKMFENFQGDKVLTFSKSKGEATVCFSVTQMDVGFIEVSGRIGEERGGVRIPVFGLHNIENALAAAAGAVALGMSPQKIWKALESCKSSWGRNQWVEIRSGAKVLFDAYNSNPESLIALTQNLFELRGRAKKIREDGSLSVGYRSDVRVGRKVCRVALPNGREIGGTSARYPLVYWRGSGGFSPGVGIL